MNPEICSQPPPDIHQGQTASVTVMADSQRSGGDSGGCSSACVTVLPGVPHLTGVHTAGEELVQLDQLVRGDVELECDAVEGIVGAHLEDEARGDAA